MNHSRIIITALAGLVVALAAACGPTNIAAMKNKPRKYDRQLVTITARIIDTRDIPLTSTDYYKITDDSGELWVLTTRGVPLKGLKYTITGRYRKPDGSVSGLLLGDYIIREERREEVEGTY